MNHMKPSIVFRNHSTGTITVWTFDSQGSRDESRNFLRSQSHIEILDVGFAIDYDRRKREVEKTG